MRKTSEASHDQLEYVIKKLVTAALPQDPYPVFLVKKPDAAHGDMHIEILGSLNTATSHLLETACRRILGQTFSISYTTEDKSISRAVEIEQVVHDLASRIVVSNAEAPIYGPITPQEAAANAAADAAARAQQQSAWEQQAKAQQEEIESARHRDGVYAD